MHQVVFTRLLDEMFEPHSAASGVTEYTCLAAPVKGFKHLRGVHCACGLCRNGSRTSQLLLVVYSRLKVRWSWEFCQAGVSAH